MKHITNKMFFFILFPRSRLFFTISTVAATNQVAVSLPEHVIHEEAPFTPVRIK